MKKRKEKIKEVESLIEKNRISRRKFVDSLGKTVALSSITALGVTSFLSCKKEYLDEEIETIDSLKLKTCFGTVEHSIIIVCDSTPVNCSPVPYNCNPAIHQGGSGS